MPDADNRPSGPARDIQLYAQQRADSEGAGVFCQRMAMNRHARYYGDLDRFPALRALPTGTAEGPCPLCDSPDKAGTSFAADLVSGAWRCGQCGRSGDMYALEYYLAGGHGAEDAADERLWLACEAAVDSAVASCWRLPEDSEDQPLSYQAIEGALTTSLVSGGRLYAPDVVALLVDHIQELNQRED